MIKCITCGTDNIESSQFCDECGNQLVGAGGQPDGFQPAYEAPKFQSASVTSVGIPLIIEEPKIVEKLSESPEAEPAQNQNIHARLVIERGSSVGVEFQLSSDESQIGRWDADNGIFPDVDLDSHDPEAKVSRRHARIVRDSGRFTIEDLESTNGTFVNRGRRLIPGTPHLLSDGDEIIVGKTFLRFRVV